MLVKLGPAQDELFSKYRHHLNTLRPRQNRNHFPDNSFRWIFLNENVWNFIKISLKFGPKGSINNISALVQIMVWRLVGTKPLSEPMMVSLLKHLCVTWPQWVKSYGDRIYWLYGMNMYLGVVRCSGLSQETMVKSRNNGTCYMPYTLIVLHAWVQHYWNALKCRHVWFMFIAAWFINWLHWFIDMIWYFL